MNKKLLMNNCNYNSLLPTQDGLVCWLDAFDLTSFEVGDIWNDRTSNGNNGVVKHNYLTPIINNGTVKGKSEINIPNITKNLTNYTVEVGYQDLKDGYWFGLWGNRSGDNGTSFYQTGDSFQAYPSLIAVPPTKTGVSGGKNYVSFTFDENYTKIYHNGELYYSQPKSVVGITPSTANYLCVMGRKSNNPTDNTDTLADSRTSIWYFVRIYNKTLTEEEVLNNYNYELSLTRGE